MLQSMGSQRVRHDLVMEQQKVKWLLDIPGVGSWVLDGKKREQHNFPLWRGLSLKHVCSSSRRCLPLGLKVTVLFAVSEEEDY